MLYILHHSIGTHTYIFQMFVNYETNKKWIVCLVTFALKWGRIIAKRPQPYMSFCHWISLFLFCLDIKWLSCFFFYFSFSKKHLPFDFYLAPWLQRTSKMFHWLNQNTNKARKRNFNWKNIWQKCRKRNVISLQIAK